MPGTVPDLTWWRSQLFRGRRIHQPDHLARCRADDLGGALVGRKRSFEDLLEHAGFAATADQEYDFAAEIDDRGRQGDPPHADFGDVLGHDPALVLVDGRQTRKQRCGVAVVAHAEQDYVQPRRVVAEEGFHLALVLLRGLFGWDLALHSIHLRCRNRHLVEQRL